MPYTNPRGPVHIITGSAVSITGEAVLASCLLIFTASCTSQVFIQLLSPTPRPSVALVTGPLYRCGNRGSGSQILILSQTQQGAGVGAGGLAQVYRTDPKTEGFLLSSLPLNSRPHSHSTKLVPDDRFLFQVPTLELVTVSPEPFLVFRSARFGKLLASCFAAGPLVWVYESFG